MGQLCERCGYVSVSRFYYKAKYPFRAGERHVLSSSFAATPDSPLVDVGGVDVGVTAVVVEIEGTTS